MRSRVLLLALIAAIGSIAVPAVAFAQTVTFPFFGPIVPETVAECAAGWAALMDVANRIIILGLALLIVFVAPLTIAYAGFLMVVNPFNASGKEKAKSMLQNLVIGIVVALAAWLIVDAFFAVFTKDGRPFGEKWSSIITSGGLNPCLKQQGSLINLNQAGSRLVGTDSSGNAIISLPSNPGCSPSTIMQAAATGGYTLTQAQANTLSCIAVPESSCGRNISGATTPDGKPTTATGMFQVVFGYNDQCHNLNIPVCTQVAQSLGYQVSGNLNCSQAFSGGRPKPGMEQQAAACKAAASNLNCNASAAACLVKARPSFSDWTSDARSSVQKGCISKYANG